MRRAGVLLALAAVLVLTVATAAGATWQAGGVAGGKGRAATTTLPAGVQPTASAAGSTVTVSWTATPGPPPTGYTVRAYNATNGNERGIVGGSCGALVTAPTVSCSETSAPDGAWQYTVTPHLQGWIGGESPKSDPVTVDTTAPSPTALMLENGTGGTVGLLDPELDEVNITFSEPLAVSSLCSTWSGNTGNQTLTGSDVTVTVADGAGSNVLTVATSQCTLQLGAIALGNEYLVGPADATFSGSGAQSSSVRWNATTRTLTIHLGALTAGTLATAPLAAAVITYTPTAGITDVIGNPLPVAAFPSATPQSF